MLSDRETTVATNDQAQKYYDALIESYDVLVEAVGKAGERGVKVTERLAEDIPASDLAGEAAGDGADDAELRLECRVGAARAFVPGDQQADNDPAAEDQRAHPSQRIGGRRPSDQRLPRAVSRYRV